MDEGHPLRAQSPYAASKIAADQLGLSFWHSYGLPVSILRPFNTYGPRQSARAVVPTIITQALASDKVFLGSMYPTRDLSYVGDIVEAFVKIADQITGAVLDAGCGTGSLALFLAQQGHPVMGIDFIDRPIEEARRKAAELGVDAEFARMDALQLRDLDRKFDSVVDCGLFHVFSDEDRGSYVEGLAHVTRPGGKVFLMCFSDQEPGDDGPRRISQGDIQEAFADGWVIESITPARLEPNPELERKFATGGPKAWLAVIRRENGVLDH